jgi:hypothetical protein
VIPGAGCNGFPSINAAVNYINTYGIANNGNVIFSIAGGYAETAPSGGYSITASGTATSNIIFQKTSGVNPTITAGLQLSGSYTDAIFKLIGADYIVIQNLTLKENTANTVTTQASNTMTEWGVALLHATTSNGAQNNIIQNNTITLNKAYQNSVGIYSNNRHSATAATVPEEIVSAAGQNSNNKIYADSISIVNVGIVFIGSTGSMDFGNDIGGSSSTTSNVITSWGSGVVSQSAIVRFGVSNSGIYIENQLGVNVSRNVITSTQFLMGGTSGIKGIYADYVGSSPSGVFTNTISYNTISIYSGDTT